MEYIASTLNNLIHQTAFFNLTWGNYVMILVACFFLYLAIRHEFEPLLLLPIAFGMLLVNIYPDIMLHPENAANGAGGLLYYFYKLDELAILPSLIFMGVGAMTDLPNSHPIQFWQQGRFLCQHLRSLFAPENLPTTRPSQVCCSVGLLITMNASVARTLYLSPFL